MAIRRALAREIQLRGILEVGVCSQSVWWFDRQAARPFWINITEYSAGCIRFSTRFQGRVPKRVWKQPLPPCGGRCLFELTFQSDEIDSDLFAFLFAASYSDSVEARPPWFSKSGTLSTNSEWSEKAHHHWLATHPDAFKRRPNS